MLPADLAAALLNVPFDAEVASQPEFHQSIGQRLTAAKAELEAATVAANQVLSSNPLMEIIAEHAARLVGRRGRPTVVVASSGDVMLEIHYLAAGEPLPPVKPKKLKMPPISEIRREAVLLGIDPTPYGKNKTRLIAAVDAAKAVVSPPVAPKAPAPKPPAPKPKRMKTAPAITPAVPVELVGREVIPLDVDEDDEDDLSSLFADDPPKAPAPKPVPEPPVPKAKPLSKPRPTPASPKRGTPAVKAAAPKRMGRSLSAIAQNAENEVDIDAILAKPPPKIPRED
jgi:hypothetical protein